MPPPPDEPVCTEFQPNIFDPSRCHDCLRQKHAHVGAEAATPATGKEVPSGIGKGAAGTSAEMRMVTGEERGSPPAGVKAGDSSGRKEAGLEVGADRWRLKVDTGHVNTPVMSGSDQSDSQEQSSDTDDTDIHFLPPQRPPAMTRLDRPAHRPDPRVWMEEARAKDAFSKPPGFRGEGETRDSGYFSLGRAAGSRSLRDQSPPAPFRHFERGHPVFNTRNIEPKDTVPFRNRHVAAPPDRPSQEDQDQNIIKIPPPDPYEIAVEVEAQVGPRSPSPTPFKIAESLASTGQRRQGSSYGKGNLSSHLSSSNQQPGRPDSSRISSTLQSRSSSPSRGRSPFGRSEGSPSFNTRSNDGGGRSQGLERGSRSPSQAPSGLQSETGSVPRSHDGRSSSPPKRSYDLPGASSLRKTESVTSLNHIGSSPSRTTNADSPGYSILRKGPRETSRSAGFQVTSETSRNTSSIRLRRNTSSQSSMDSWESEGRSGEESGGNSREEYTVLADVPRVRMINQREEAVKPQHRQRPPEKQELFKPASHSVSRHPSRERDNPGGPDRELLGRGNLSRSHSSTSLFRQPDLLNFKKGWMSKMDDVGEWKKHWFVLTDAGLKYYRDSGAEENDEPDGEIDLISCLKVSEFDVEKNYGFQIQTREMMVTLSAMTAGIRRNWIEVLRKSVRPSRSPDLTQLPDSSSDKENSHGAPLLSARRGSARHPENQSSSAAQQRFDYVELKGPAGSDHWQRMEEEIENKWEEFERLPLKEMKALPISSQSSGQPANEALHREVASLRSSLAALERAQRHVLQEVQRQHERQSREAQEEQERLLLEETRATAQAMEALKKAHKEQLEREVERATRLCGGTGDSVGLRNQLQADTQALQRELSGLSERYSNKCLELNRAQQDAAERERELSRRERDLDLLRKENQDLKARLVEAVGRSRSVGAGQGSGGVTYDNRAPASCELEVLVQVKEKEVEYLHQEIGCLRNELQALNTEKRLSSERRRELEVELSSMRGRSLREVQSLKEHLRLALAALQEGQVLGNSLDH
ncbi:hypothetical protein NHX12_031455 [Muraenolepis orangiensis]|uniref:PH domain-containing protein n=1 Tax=Muraenolepis orangiensis TaxID=630683 RepID=A0A9Q0IIX8_9TELE|nr:hypothetical protein NHX12_031455 [Muraenolepis orangiensis]